MNINYESNNSIIFNKILQIIQFIVSYSREQFKNKSEGAATIFPNFRGRFSAILWEYYFWLLLTTVYNVLQFNFLGYYNLSESNNNNKKGGTGWRETAKSIMKSVISPMIPLAWLFLRAGRNLSKALTPKRIC